MSKRFDSTLASFIKANSYKGILYLDRVNSSLFTFKLILAELAYSLKIICKYDSYASVDLQDLGASSDLVEYNDSISSVYFVKQYENAELNSEYAKEYEEVLQAMLDKAVEMYERNNLDFEINFSNNKLGINKIIVLDLPEN